MISVTFGLVLKPKKLAFEGFVAKQTVLSNENQEV